MISKAQEPVDVLVYKNVKMNSILAAMLISYDFIVAALSTFLNGKVGIGGLIAGVIIIIFIINTLLSMDFKINIKSLLLLMYITFIILISMIRLNFFHGTIDKFTSFMFFGIIGYMVGSKKMDTQLILKNIIYISLLSIVSLNSLLYRYSNEVIYKRINMGLSYSLLPLVFASILHFIYYRNYANVLIWIGYFLNAYHLYLLIFFGTRGSIMSITFFTLFLLLNKYTTLKNNTTTLVHKKKWFYLFIFFVGLIIVFFEQVFFIVHKVLSNFGIEIAIFEKTYFLIQNSGDFSNDRIVLYKEAIKGISESPLCGYGIGAFEYITGVRYPHNLILELLFEGGLFLAVPIIYILFVGVRKAMNGSIKNKNKYLYSVLLINLSLPRLMLSASFWNLQIFWMLIAFIVNII